MAVAIWLVRRIALRTFAACELSVASGSDMPRIATAACNTRIGSVAFGMSLNAAINSRGISRAAVSATVRPSSCAALGSSPYRSRYVTSSNVALRASSSMS